MFTVFFFLADLSSIARIFDPSTVSLTTVGGIILVLLALDVAFTLVFATVFSGRSRQDYTFPFAGEFLGNFVNRYAVAQHTTVLSNLLSALPNTGCMHPCVLYSNPNNHYLSHFQRSLPSMRISARCL